MLKQESGMISQENGDVTRVIRFTRGPMRECTNCPCLLVIGEQDGSGILAQKRGFCAYYMAQLMLDGDFPKNCRVAAITVEEIM